MFLVKLDPADPQQLLLDWGTAPPPAPDASASGERLKKLDSLRAQNLISAEEYAAQRQRLPSEL